VIGWYRNAVVYRFRQDFLPRKRERRKHVAVARVVDSVLLAPHKRSWSVKAGKGGIGQSNICYLYHDDGRRKKQSWQDRILEKIENYRPKPKS
jgi:hypothetical protein